jgi:predicted SprT family Zn-dependent metalloprotease
VEIPNIKAMFIELNDEHFDGKIPDIPVVWNKRMTTTAGYCRYRRSEGRNIEPYKIDLSYQLFEKLEFDIDKVKRTLTHEMVHAYLVHMYNERGHKWRFQQMMIDITGEYKNHRCHDYDTEGLRRKQVKKIRCECNRCGYVYHKARMPKHAAYSDYRHRGCGGKIEFTDTRINEAASKVKIF